jgi:hypothetical protein
MNLLKSLILTLVLALAGLEAHAAPLTFYSYSVSESLPCTSLNCSSNEDITLQGTLTTDGLGALTAKDIVVWDLNVTLTGQAPIRLTQNNGSFSTAGSPQILATGTDLTITRNTTSDAFSLLGNNNADASWFYGVSSANTLFYNTTATDPYYAQQMLSTPSTFTAAAVSAVETPEPASRYLIFIASLVLLAASVCWRKLERLGRD